MVQYFFIFLGFLFFSYPTLATDYVLSKGQSLDIKAQPSLRVRVTNGQVLKAKELGSAVRLTGIKTGQASVVVGKQIHRVFVLDVRESWTYQRLKEILKNIMGLKVFVSAKKVDLGGELLRLKDWITLAESFEGQEVHYNFRAKIDDEMQSSLTEHFEKLVEQDGLSLPTFHFLPPVQARLSSEQVKFQSAYERLLKPYGIQVVLDPNAVSLSPMVEVEILVAEVKRRFFQKIGLQWPNSYSTTLFGSGGLSNSNIEFVLHAMEENGEGKILATPRLLCRSGKEAEFLAGGEFPIRIRTNKVSDVIWKKHGVLLKIKPKADISGRMSIDVETEVSMMNFSDKVEDLPSLSTNRIHSHFDLDKTKTIALSGLIKKEIGQMKSGLPLLSRIPILGALFSSKDYLSNESELVFFVTPRLVTHASHEAPKLPKGFEDDE